MSTRPPSESWQSRGPALPPLDAAPVVTFTVDPDAGDHWHVQFGPFTGPLRATRHAAEADADALTAALLPSLAIARRAGDLRSDPGPLATPADLATWAARLAAQPGTSPWWRRWWASWRGGALLVARPV